MWIDITDLCRDAAKELTHQQPMINIEDFSLHDAMSAVELMDPKMDQCYGVTCSIKTQDLLVAQIPESFTHTAALKIMQALIVQETSFLDGASYLESTHQCIFMWPGSWDSLSSRDCFSSRAVLSFAETLDRSLAMITKGILAADIYEDEDYQPVSTTVLSETLTDEEATGGCATVLLEIENILEECSGDEEASAVIKKLKSVIIARRDLHLFYQSVGNWIHTAISMATRAKTNPLEPMRMEVLRKSCQETKIASETVLSVLSDLQDTFNFPKTETEKTERKEKAEKIEKDNVKNGTEKTEVKIGGNKEESVKSSGRRTVIIPNTPTVPVDNDVERIILEEASLQEGDFLGYKEHSDILFAFSSVLVKVLQPSAVRTIRDKSFSESVERIKVICAEMSHVCSIFDKFSSPDLGLLLPDFDMLLHTAVELCANKMHLFSRSFFLGVLYTFLPSLPQLIVNSMSARGFPDIILNNPQVRDHWIKLSVSRTAWDTLKVLTVNRNRLLGKLDNLLGTWGNNSSEAAYLDKIFQDAKPSNGHQEASDQLCTCWIMSASTLLMDIQMGLTVENELLGMTEMAYFYWYWDYVCATRAWSMDKLRTVKYLAAVRASSTPIPPTIMDPEELIIRARGQVCRGLFRIFMAASDLRLFKPLDTTYTTVSWKFEQRFASFRSVPNPPVLTYEDFESTVSSGREGLSGGNGSSEGDSDPMIILSNASLCFGNAKKFLLEIRRIEQEHEKTEKPEKMEKREVCDKSGNGKGGRKEMSVADCQACAATMSLMKFAINSSVNILRATQLMKTLAPPLPSLTPPPAPPAQKGNKKTAKKDQNNKNENEKNEKIESLLAITKIENTIFDSISMTLDFTKNSQYPLVEFKTI